jgi:hypothetical protein
VTNFLTSGTVSISLSSVGGQSDDRRAAKPDDVKARIARRLGGFPSPLLRSTRETGNSVADIEEFSIVLSRAISRMARSRLTESNRRST